MKLTKAQRRSVVNDIPIEGFTIVNICCVDLGRVNHQLDMYLSVITRESDDQLFGVPWGNCPNDYTIGDYDDEQIDETLPIIPLWARVTTKTVVHTVTVYEGAGQSLLTELNLRP